MDLSIFRAYDIRGIYPTELSEGDAYLIGRAIYAYLRPKKVGLGYDARVSAPKVQAALAQAFVDEGCEVVGFGMIATDMAIFAAGAYDYDLTIEVTASHNPKEWIGMKLHKAGGEGVGGNGETLEISELVTTSLEVPEINLDIITNLPHHDLLADWIDHVAKFTGEQEMRPMKIVVDAGNGVAGGIVGALFEKFPIELVPMYFEPDGTFPNHLADPSKPENIKDLIEKVKTEGADLGMAFDGDADRVFLVDENGQGVSGAETMAMVMDEILNQDPSRIVLYNPLCGWIVRDVIAKHNSPAYEIKVGGGYVKREMRAQGAYFSGETSGHYYFQENFNGDSGLIAAVYVLTLMSQTGKKLSELVQPYRKYPRIPETNFPVYNAGKILEHLAAKYPDGEHKLLDGLTVTYPTYWFNVRLSSNEPLLRLNVEALDEQTLREKSHELAVEIAKFGTPESA